MRKIGINFQNTDELTSEQQVQLLAELGVQGTFTGMREVEEQERLANLFAKYNIAYENLHAPFRPINDIWLDSEVGENVYQGLIECVERCAQFSIPTMVIHMSSGNTPPPVTDLGRMRYEGIIEHAAKKNVVLAFENLRKLSHLAWVFETFQDHDTVKFCWDSGHQQCYTPNIPFMKLYGDKLQALHLHDNYGILYQDDHLLPFDGVGNFDEISKAIKESGYEGTIMLEVARGNHERYQIPIREYLEQAAEKVKRLVKMIDEA